MDNVEQLIQRVVSERRAQNRLTAAAIVILGMLLVVAVFLIYSGEKRQAQLDDLHDSLTSDRVCIVIDENNVDDFIE